MKRKRPVIPVKPKIDAAGMAEYLKVYRQLSEDQQRKQREETDRRVAELLESCPF
jgi:hypothetical protein